MQSRAALIALGSAVSCAGNRPMPSLRDATADSPAAPPPGASAKRRKRRRAVAALCVGLLLVPPALEIVARLVMIECWPSYFLPAHFPHDSARADYGASAVEWRTNAQGFRDRDHAIAKPSGAFRVACIGDSFLEGPQRTPLPERLEDLLRRARDGVEVLNFSRPGIGPVEYYLLLEQTVLAYDPDVVLVFFCMENDFVGLDRADLGVYDEARGFFRRAPEASWYGTWFPRSTVMLADAWAGHLLTKWSALPTGQRWRTDAVRPGTLVNVGLLLSRWIAAAPEAITAHLRRALRDDEVRGLTQHAVPMEFLAVLAAIGMGVPMADGFFGTAAQPWTDPAVEAAEVEGASAALVRMAHRCRDRGVELAVVVIPTSDADPECRDAYARLGATDVPLLAVRHRQCARLLALLAAAGVRTVDLTPALDAGTYLKFDTHWTDRGVDVAARVVAAALGY